MKNILIAVSLAASIMSSTVFAANTKEGDMNLTISAQGLQKEGKAIVSKKRGYGGEVELSYFAADNVAVVGGVGFNKFQALKKSDSPLIKGPKVTYIPIHLGVRYHFSNPNGFNPFVGAGYQYAHGKYKILHAGATVAKKNIHAAYIEGGADLFAPDDVAVNIKIKKVFSSKATTYNDLALSASEQTSKIKYNPIILSLGATFKVN